MTMYTTVTISIVRFVGLYKCVLTLRRKIAYYLQSLFDYS